MSLKRWTIWCLLVLWLLLAAINEAFELLAWSQQVTL